MIYFLRIKDIDYVKIGYTKHKSLIRLNSYSTHSPFKHELLLFIEGNVEYEQSLHKLFKSYLVKGEWFTLSNEILDFIQKNKPKEYAILKKRNFRERLYSFETKNKALEMYNSGIDISKIALFLGTTNKKATKVCWDMQGKRPEKELLHPKGFYSKANKIAYNKKKFKLGKITLEELNKIISETYA